MTQVFRVADITTNGSTRERGRQLYPALAASLRAALARGEEPAVSFDGVDLVTPSFLDETIVRLLREWPGKAVTLWYIRDFPVRSLERMLDAIGWRVVVQQEREGVYRLAAAA